MSRFSTAHVFYRCAHICRSHLSRSHTCTPSTKAHFVNRIAPCLQGSQVHTSFSCVCLIHRRANILQVKHHVNWFTSHSSIASSNVHISFTLADPVQTVPPMQFIAAYHFHKCKSCSHPFPTHTRRSTVQMCTPRCTMKDIGSISFECVRSIRKVS